MKRKAINRRDAKKTKMGGAAAKSGAKGAGSRLLVLMLMNDDKLILLRDDIRAEGRSVDRPSVASDDEGGIGCGSMATRRTP